MSGAVDPRLLRLLGGEALVELRRRLRQRYERGTSGGVFRLNGLNEAERAALASLLGRPPRLAESMTLDITALDVALRHAGIAASLRDGLERLDGPLVDRAAERAAMQMQWDSLRAVDRDARLAALLAYPRGMVLVKRLARSPSAAVHLLDAAQAVLRALPAAGIPRSRLAAEVLGDAHGLDQGRPTASLVLAALRRESTGAEAQTETDGSEAADESLRAVWAGAGVLVNELARPALFLNLPMAEGQAGGMKSGEPAYVSLRALLRAPPAWAVAGRDIHVCENPNLVAIAADTLGSRCTPLTCTDGMPGAAQRTLLLQLAQAGAFLHYHGDFDWAGLRIGNWVMRTCGARPWRYGTADYLAAVRAVPVHARALGPDSVAADWDADLASAMRARAQAVDEEAVAAALMPDLDGSELATIPA
ncbi:MAG: TIGR02679 family protein [Sulfuritalea sp.]|nr:TIGR02679 family protein [Sulfuritalea sp.]MDP1984759.1 TIGR02679 family protein [Sulfuritalea sp.]